MTVKKCNTEADILAGCAREFGEIQQQNISQNEKIDRVEKKLDEIIVCLKGNGKKGVVERVGTLELKATIFIWCISVIGIGTIGLVGRLLHTWITS